MGTIPDLKKEELYRQQMSRFILPALVIATKATPEAELHIGQDRSIHHDHWLVRLGNPAELQNTDFWVPFDSVVHTNGRRLNELQFRADYMIKKVMVLTSLSGTHGERFTSRDVCMQSVRRFDWFVRWRLALSIETNEGLTPKHFQDDFISALKSGSILGFIPLEDRLELFFAKLRKGQIKARDLLLNDHHDRRRRNLLGWETLAAHLGVTHLPLSQSANFKMMLLDGLAQIDDEHARIIATSIRPTESDKQEGFSKGTVRNYLRIWQSLHRLGTTGAVTWNTLSFDPFRKKSTRKFADEVTEREASRTKTILPDDFYRLTRAATRWLLDFHEYIELAVGLVRKETGTHQIPLGRRIELQRFLDAKRPPGAPKLYFGWLLSSKATIASKDERISIGHAAKLLMAASMLVIGCYSPRRGAEITQLRVGCIELSSAGAFLNAFIEKTERGVKAVPVPAIVKHAVAVMERLDVRDPSDPGSQWLFKIRKDKGFIVSKITQNISEFVQYIRLEPPSGVTDWDLASHQLRRGHAIFFYYGNEWSDIDDTAYSLLHLDVEMTHIYVSEVIPGEILRLTDELRSRLLIDKEHRSQDFLDWEKSTKERLRNLREFKGEFEEVRLEAYVYHAMQLYSNKDFAIGGYAKKFYVDIDTIADLAKKDVRVVSRGNDPGPFMEAFAKRLMAHAARHYLEPVPGGAVHCAARRGNDEDLKVAECLKIKANFPGGLQQDASVASDYVDFRFSGALPCIKCPLCLALKSNQRVLDQKLATLEDAVARAPTPAAKADRNIPYLNFRNEYLRRKNETNRGAE